MPITYEETLQTVLNLIQEREALKLKIRELEAELTAIRQSDQTVGSQVIQK